VRSHFLEFVDVQTPERPALSLNELQVGARYRPLLTTSGGLYRYDLGDCVEVLGYYGNTPQLKFSGRLDQRSDLRGEKLNAAQVDAVLEQACRSCGVQPQFLLMAPTSARTPSYCLFIEADVAHGETLMQLGERIGRLLCESYHYKLCRAQGQLDHLQVVSVNGGYQRCQQKRAAQGMKLGNIKPTRLASETFWYEVLTDPVRQTQSEGHGKRVGPPERQVVHLVWAPPCGAGGAFAGGPAPRVFALFCSHRHRAHDPPSTKPVHWSTTRPSTLAVRCRM
jgi:hypothetical protein